MTFAVRTWEPGRSDEREQIFASARFADRDF